MREVLRQQVGQIRRSRGAGQGKGGDVETRGRKERPKGGGQKNEARVAAVGTMSFVTPYDVDDEYSDSPWRCPRTFLPSMRVRVYLLIALAVSVIEIFVVARPLAPPATAVAPSNRAATLLSQTVPAPTTTQHGSADLWRFFLVVRPEDLPPGCFSAATTRPAENWPWARRPQ